MEQLKIINEAGDVLGYFRKPYLTRFVNPTKKYEVDYLASHQSESGKRENKFFEIKGEDLTENQIFQLFLKEKL
jgi:hypothetical protein